MNTRSPHVSRAGRRSGSTAQRPCDEREEHRERQPVGPRPTVSQVAQPDGETEGDEGGDLREAGE